MTRRNPSVIEIACECRNARCVGAFNGDFMLTLMKRIILQIESGIHQAPIRAPCGIKQYQPIIHSVIKCYKYFDRPAQINWSLLKIHYVTFFF